MEGDILSEYLEIHKELMKLSHEELCASTLE